MRGSEDSPASMSDLHFAVGPAQRRYSPPQLTAPACAARLHILASLWLSNVRAQRVLAGAIPLSCTPEWHEPAGLSPARARLLTASFLLVNRCAPETLIAWSTTTACFRLLPFSVDLRADEAAGAGFEAQAGRSWSSSCSARTSPSCARCRRRRRRCRRRYLSHRTRRFVHILFVYGQDGKGVHRARTPGRLIVVDFLFGQNVYFLCSLLPPPPPLPLPLPNPCSTAVSYICVRDRACGWVSVGSTSIM